jgi:hypothetical protein
MYSKNDAAPFPPMGWNSYDYYNTMVTEKQVRDNADYMAGKLKQFGWEYIVIDIQWSNPGAGTDNEQYQYIPFSRFCLDDWSRQIPAANRFPSSAGGKGFGPLSGYIHSLGLKFGIHIMRGIPRYAAHNHLSVKTHDGSLITADKIADPYSISRWNPDMYGVDYTKKGAQDYYDSVFQFLKAMFERCEVWQKHTENGCWPDCDMLPVEKLGYGFSHGVWNTRFTKDEQYTMLTHWSMFRTPLMIGTDLPQLDSFTTSLLTNTEVLALGKRRSQAYLSQKDSSMQIWLAEKDGGGTYAAVFNLGDTPYQ